MQLFFYFEFALIVCDDFMHYMTELLFLRFGFRRSDAEPEQEETQCSEKNNQRKNQGVGNKKHGKKLVGFSTFGSPLEREQDYII